MFYELIPAYGRDYKTAKEITDAFKNGTDFKGDYQMQFQYCSITDFPKGSTVILRYQQHRKLTTYKVN